MPDATGTMEPRRLRRIIGALLTLILVAGGLVFARDEIADRIVDPAPTVPAATPSASLTETEQAFYDYVAPRLANVSAEGNELVRLANNRSRNLMELQTRGTRVENGSQEIDDYINRYGVPPRFDVSIRDYRHAIAAIRGGMDEARSGFLNLDWDRVASAADQFDAGADGLSSALANLRRAGAAPLPIGATPASAVV